MAKTKKKRDHSSTKRLFRADQAQDEMFEKSVEQELEEAKAQEIDCLGLKFNNDQKRREYFTEKLREKLGDPEFKKTEGFPIGTDENILAISDPPYFTACPNPFIADFVRHFGKPFSAKDVYDRKPFATDVTEGKNDPIYDAHPYHTKVPPKALMRLLLHYTKPGDVVLDAFCGSGMLGVAAALCYDPGKYLGKYSGEAGPRYAIMSDISPLATAIANVNSRLSASSSRFTSTANALAKNVAEKYSWMYKTHHSLHHDPSVMGEIIYSIWSEFYECPGCSKAIRAWDTIVDRKGKQLRKHFHCPFCNLLLEKDSLIRITETYYDSLLGQQCKRNRSELVWIHYKVGKRRYEKSPDADDLALLTKIDALGYPVDTPAVKINFRDAPWGDLYRAGYHAGVTHVHHFFSKRNLVTLMALRNASRTTTMTREMLFVLSGFLDNHASKRNRYLIDRHHPSGTTCGPLSNSLYIPELQCEVNPFITWQKTVKKQKKAFAITRPSTSIITTESSRLSQVPDRSVEYVFVDPPFGENIFYSESNFCWEYFIGVFTNAKSEAIVSKYQGKAIDEYRRRIEDVFSQCYRVLKPGRWMTVEFSNRNNIVWNALSEAIQAAGFVIADVRVFDKRQGTIRQDMGQSIRKDLIISAYRPNGGLEDRLQIEAGTTEGVWDFVRTHLRQLPVFVVDSLGKSEIIAERLGHFLFDRMVAFHVQRGMTVPMAAPEFSMELYRQFPERDGMFFLPEQAAEYDKKRLSAAEVLQLQLFVTDESSAIQWLKQQLTKAPQTFQELHPQFMKEIGAWQKFEKPLELLELLRENFLLYDGKEDVPNPIQAYLFMNWPELQKKAEDDPRMRSMGKDRWYVPDPNRASDLEKLRERGLLREFWEYLPNGYAPPKPEAFSGQLAFLEERRKTSSSLGKKLKVIRLEAVRVGFRYCWQNGDYYTIVAVANRIPEHIIQEDPKLLMWYDQARTRLGENL